MSRAREGFGLSSFSKVGNSTSLGPWSAWAREGKEVKGAQPLAGGAGASPSIRGVKQPTSVSLPGVGPKTLANQPFNFGTSAGSRPPPTLGTTCAQEGRFPIGKINGDNSTLPTSGVLFPRRPRIRQPKRSTLGQFGGFAMRTQKRYYIL